MTMSTPLVLSYWNLNHASTGGVRRIHALLQTLGDGLLLCQPGTAHPHFDSATYRVDFGKQKLLINWGMFNFLWPGNSRLVKRVIAEHKPSFIVLTSVWCYFPLRTITNVPILLDAHDVNAVAIAERFGAHHFFTRLVRKYEARVVRNVNHVCACSEVDRERFITMYDVAEDRVSVVPNGVDVSAVDSVSAPHHLSESLEQQVKDKTVLFFMGTLGYQPNREAYNILNDTIMPALQERMPDRFCLLVCGGRPPEGNIHSSIIYCGRLSDTELVRTMKRADICVAPITTGGGTRLKILEYMASGRPVVSTAKGAEGICCEPGQHIVLADINGFHDAIISLASMPHKASEIGSAGHDLVKATYDWNTSIKATWRQVFNKWMGS